MATITTAPVAQLHEYLSKVCDSADVRAGAPLPLGTQAIAGGINFALFSRHATRVRLELFAHPEDAKPVRVIDLDPVRHRTGDVWHVWVAGINPGQLYAYRVGRTLSSPAKAIVSMSIGCSWIPSRPRFRSCRRGISHRHVATTPRRRSKTW